MIALAAAHPSESDFVRIVAELVSDISDLIQSRQVRASDPGFRRAVLLVAAATSLVLVLALVFVIGSSFAVCY